MKKYVLAGIVALCAGSFAAQSQVSYGVHGSFILSSMKFNNGDAESGEPGFDDYTKMRPSFRAGIIVNIPVSEKMAFMPQLNYVSGGVKLKADEKFTDDDETYTATMTGNFKPAFLEVPLNVVYTAKLPNGAKFFAGAGPAISMGLGGSYDLKFEMDLPGDQIPDFPADMNVNDGKIKFDGKKDSEDDQDLHLKRFNFGANVMAGYQFQNGMFIQANYNHGFSKLNTDESGKLKTRYFGLGIGYFFN